MLNKIEQGDCPEQLIGKHSYILSADTIVVLDGSILGKPKDEQDAMRMLKLLQGKTHQVYTGICLLQAGRGIAEAKKASGVKYQSILLDNQATAMVGHTVSHVTFRQMSDDEIRAYIHTGIPMDKAGSYGVQGLGAIFIDKIDGDFYSIMGLPLALLYTMLEDANIYSILDTNAK